MSQERSAQLDADIAEALRKGRKGLDQLQKAAVMERAQPKRFPIGSHVKGLRFAFTGHVGKVTGYNGDQIKVRFLQPVKVGSQDVRVAEFDVDTIAPISREQLAVDKLLQRFRVLDDQRKQASAKLHEAAVQSDRVRDSEERVPYAQAGDVVKSARRKAADRNWAYAVRAERTITAKMRDLILKIRAIDPTRVPHGWQNTR